MDTATTTATETQQPPPPEEKPIRYLDKEIRFDLRAEEFVSYGRKLASLHTDRTLLEEKLSSVKKQFAVDIGNIENEIDRLSDALNKGKELRLTRCYEIWRNNVIEIRSVTDHVVLDTRQPTHADRQTPVPGTLDGAVERGADHIPGLDDDDDDDHELDAAAPLDTTGIVRDAEQAVAGEMVKSSVGVSVFVGSENDGDQDGDQDGDDTAAEPVAAAAAKTKRKKRGAASTPPRKGNGKAK